MSSHGFGQRPGNVRETLRAMQHVHYERTPDETEHGSSKLRKMVFWIGAGALLVGIYVATLKGSGQGLDRFFKRSSGTATVEVYVAPGAKDLLLEQVNKECRVRGDAAKKASEGNAVRQSAAYVACLAAERPLRLCQVTHRTHLLAAMRNYYRLQARNREAKIKSDPQVIEALKGAITNGFVPHRDIVASAEQSDLDVALRGVEVRKSGCGGG